MADKAELDYIIGHTEIMNGDQKYIITKRDGEIRFDAMNISPMRNHHDIALELYGIECDVIWAGRMAIFNTTLLVDGSAGPYRRPPQSVLDTFEAALFEKYREYHAALIDIKLVGSRHY